MTALLTHHHENDDDDDVYVVVGCDIVDDNHHLDNLYVDDNEIMDHSCGDDDADDGDDDQDDNIIIRCNFPSFCGTGGVGVAAAASTTCVGMTPSPNTYKEREQFMKRFPKSEVNIPSLEYVENMYKQAALYYDNNKDNRNVEIINDGEMERRQQMIFQDSKIGGGGISACMIEKETPQALEENLEIMEYELIQLSRHTAYEQALDRNAAYVRDPKLRIAFLRSELYDPRKAAHRFIRWCEEKLSLFGLERLTRDITLDDLEPEDHFILASGCMQISSKLKDRYGRHLYIGLPQLRPFESPTEAMKRCHYFQMQEFAKDPETQKRGLVGIIYMVDQPTSLFEGLDRRQEFWELNRLQMSLPLRWSSNHLCFNDPKLKAALSMRFAIMSTKKLLSHFFHFGSHVEVIYKLMSCGIPAKSFPVDPTGMINLDLYNHWVSSLEYRNSTMEGEYSSMALTTTMEADDYNRAAVQHQAIEKLTEYGLAFEIPDKPSSVSPPSRPTKRTINELNPNQVQMEGKLDAPRFKIEPSRFDVVFGRGKGNQNRPGNARFRLIIDMHMAEYEKANKTGKTAIAERVIRVIQDSSGRFLKDDTASNDGGWEEVVDLAEVRSKVSHAFRGRRAQKKNSMLSSVESKK